MHIFIVGNVLKDVYLSLDERSEHFESDKNGINWLNLSFDASKHHYFRRTSSFGGAAVSMEVLNKLGLKASIVSSDFSFDDTGIKNSAPADAYRYILTADDAVTYLTPTKFQRTPFIAPATAPDYICIDRSANFDQLVMDEIRSYLDAHPYIGLILHLKKSSDPIKNSLIPYANLIFSENPSLPELTSIAQSKIIYLTDNALTYQNIVEPISVDRIDTLTHLSMFSIAAATVLGGFLLGRTVEDSLGLARANVENSRLDTCLTLKELEELSAVYSDNPRLLAAAYMSSTRGIPKSLVFTANNIPKSIKLLPRFAKSAYENGFRFIPLSLANPSFEDQLENITKSGLVPIISLDNHKKGSSITEIAAETGKLLDNLASTIKSTKIDPRACLISLDFISADATASDKSTIKDIVAATTEVLRHHVPSNLAGIIFAPSLSKEDPEKTAAIMSSILASGPYPYFVSLKPQLLPA